MLELNNITLLDSHGEEKRPSTAYTVPKSIADWFHYSVIRGRSQVFSEVVMLTPEMAQLFLAGNEENRSVKDRHVNALAADIEAGLWELNGESIKIATDGRLTDGQHRCHAVIQAGKPIEVVVVFGVSFDSRLTTDQNLVKTAANYIVMEDASTERAEVCASIARNLIIYKLSGSLGRKNGRVEITRTMVKTEYVQHKAVIDNAASVLAGVKVPKGLGGKGLLGACIVILSRVDPSAEDFILTYVNGNNLDKGDPILNVRNRALREKLTDADRFVLLTKAFNAWLDGRMVRAFYTKPRRVKARA